MHTFGEIIACKQLLHLRDIVRSHAQAARERAEKKKERVFSQDGDAPVYYLIKRYDALFEDLFKRASHLTDLSTR